MPTQRSVTGVKPLPTRFVTPPSDARQTYRPARTAWPKPATARIDLTQDAAQDKPTRATGTPVWVRPVAKQGSYTGPRQLDIRITERKVAAAAGIDGVLIAVTPPAQAASGTVRVGLDYADFAEAYGGNYGSRLRLVRIPACALTTPHLDSCRSAEPLPSTNDTRQKAVSAEVVFTNPTGAPTVLAALAGAGDEGGAGGTYAATELKPSGSWTAGGSTGSFGYSYPITAPPAASDLVPPVALSYDSGGPDGQTSSTNAQASWLGDGWSTPRSYVEQTFASCNDKPGGSASPVETYDRCYNGPILTLSLNGKSTSLIWDATKQVWKPESDNGEVITQVTNSNNGSGTYNTDYWRVTLRSGTVYEFGRNRLPGWTSGKTETASADHTPVYSPHVGDPCYNAAGFSSSVCTMAHRWNLDYVTDVHGNAMAYYYKQDTNYYGRNMGATDVPYIRDSYLDHIDYGFTDGNAYGTPPNRIVFNTDVRCLSGTCTPLTSTNKANWPDVPFDLICAQGTNCDNWSPSFFSTVRLTGIEAQQYNPGLADYEKVDSYAFTQTMPLTTDSTSPTLWLDSITRTGHDKSAYGSTTDITLPSVSFGSVRLANRVDILGGLPSFFRHRLATITTETGSVISAEYERPQPCTAPVTVSPASNTKSCYPVYWTPDGYTEQFPDWFHKYAVTKVTSTDPTGGSAGLTTSYTYVGGAAWRYDENEVVKAKYRTYGQFRGYAKVQTRAGDGVNDRRTLSEIAYYRGMSKNNNTTVVNVTDSAGGVHEDIDELAGKELETTAYLGDGGPVDNSTITSYWISAATATRARTGLPALTGQWVEPVKTYTRQAITGSGATTWRYTSTAHSYDATITSPTFGVLKHTYTHTVPVNTAYDQCTSYTYAPVNTVDLVIETRNLAGLVAHNETVAVACGGFTQGSPASVPGSVNTLTAPASVNRPAQVVTSERTFYDDPNFATTFPQPAAPTKGNVTLTQVAKDWTSGAYTYQTKGRSTYDSYGRVTDTYDAKGNHATIGYTMNSVGLVTAITNTNPAGHESAVTVNPRRGSTLTSTDINDVVTRQHYDALGRVTSVWINSRLTSTLANHKFTYTIQKTGVTGVTSQKLNENNGYQTSVTIYDALLRTRQTQTVTPQSGRLITDTFHDTRGWVSATYNGWWDSATTPALTIPVSAADLGKTVYNQTFNTYDGLGRAVIVTSARDNLAISTTTTVHNGDRTTVVPPEGGVVKTNVTDPLGRTTGLHEYTTLPTVNVPTDTFAGTFSITGGTSTISTYGYDSRGNQSTLTDAANNNWTSTYNLLGQVVTKSDPDAGTSTLAYDTNGNIEQTVDSRGKTLSYDYDALNRKTAEYAATVANQATANQRAAWIYDNANNAVANMAKPIGQLTTTIAYRDGQAYTTQQQGFNGFGSSLGTIITIPASEGTLADTYTYTRTYTTISGMPYNFNYPAKGTLPAELIARRYSGLLDLPSGVAGLSSYAHTMLRDAYGRAVQQGMGSLTSAAYLTNTYDDHSGRLAEQLVTRTVATPTNVDKQTYHYDKAGNILKKSGTRLGATTPSETQCYGYDKLARLTEAWTATDNCAVTPTAGSRSMVGNAISGSAYWTSWEVDPIGNRTKQVQRTLTGGTDTTTNYTYSTSGQPHTLTSTSTTGGATANTSHSYDTAGNMTSRNAAQGNQTLTWDDAGKLAGVTGGTSGNNSFLHDADGNLLIQREPGKTTLYLPDQQLTLDTATNTVSGARHIALPGGGTAIRTGSGTNYTFALMDHQGTPTLYLDNTAQIPTWRQYTPYGGPRGTTPTTPDNRGFLNKPMSPTGLTLVGARAYDPTLGRFISLDPLQDTKQPQQWNGYSYANNTPVTTSDPTGLIPEDCLSDTDCYGYSPEALKSDGGGCKHGCGTAKNKKWGKKNGKTSSKPKPPPARCSVATPEYCHAGGSRQEGPRDILRKFLQNFFSGPLASRAQCGITVPTDACATYEYFGWGDRMTKELWLSNSFANIYLEIDRRAAAGEMGGRQDFHYSDMPKLDSFKHLGSDALNWGTKGKFGSGDWSAFTGSYDVSWKVMGYENDNPVVEYHVQNATTFHSGSRIPGVTPPRGDGNAGSGADAYPFERYLIQSYRFRLTTCVNSDCPQ